MRKTWDPTFLAVLLAAAMVAGTLAATSGLGPGQWRAKFDSAQGRVQFHLRPLTRTGRLELSAGANLADIVGFDGAAFERPGAPIRLVWRRDAGTFTFDGQGGRRPRGTFKFDPDAVFSERWRQLEFGAVADQDLLLMAALGVTTAEVERLHELGYHAIGAGQMIRVGSDPEAMAWLEEMQQFGYRPEIDDLLRLRDHGVTVGELRGFAKAELGQIGVDGFLRLRDRGIDGRYLRGVADAGVDAGNLDGVIRLHDRGISPEYVAELKAAGLPDVGIDGVIRLYERGVNGDYARGAVEAHVPEINIDGVVRLHEHGVPTEYAREVVESGLADPSVEGIVKLHSHGVPVDLVRACVRAAAGRGGVQSAILLHDHGVGADWIQEMAENGYGDLRPEEMVRLHEHGVSPDLARSLATAGHRDLPVADLIHASDHGPDSLGPPRGSDRVPPVPAPVEGR